jgi:biotin transport system substrate-specific component
MQASLQQQVLADVLVPRFGAQTRANSFIRDAVLVIGFTLFMTVCAQIAIKIPTTTVPITGQTFGALLAGGALGSKRGASSMLLYMLIGMLGLSVFTPSSSPLGDGQVFHFILPWSGSSGLLWDISSGGYIVGFIFAAYLVGLLAERGWVLRSSVPLSMLIGNLAIYAIGLPWLGILFIASGTTIPGTELTYYDAIGGSNVLDKTLKGGLYPFIGGDAIKLIAASLLLPGAWALVSKVKGKPPEE